MSPSCCPDDNVLSEYLSGALADDEIGIIQNHFEHCSRCQMTLALAVKGDQTAIEKEGLSSASPPDQPRVLLPNERWLLPSGLMVGRFKIVRPIGRGGMSQVFLARDTQLGRRVALKIIRAKGLPGTSGLSSFLVEARATAKFNHPHIVTVFDVGEFQGYPFLALEYLDGQTLRQRTLRRKNSWREVLRIAVALSSAIAEAHRHNVLHRDLKPENILIPRDGRLRVLDFGLASLVDRDSTSRRLGGTPAYWAPEIFAGHRFTKSGDIWSFGLILYELLVGRRPYTNTKWDELQAEILARPAPVLPEHSPPWPPFWPTLIDHCLDMVPQRRPSAEEIYQRLAQLEKKGDTLKEHPCPFVGLLSFTEIQESIFFGRGAETATFMERLFESPVLPIVGASGSGKTSFVQAGIIPRMREDGPLLVLKLRPGGHPFLTMARKLLLAGRDPATAKRTGPVYSAAASTSEPAIPPHPGSLPLPIEQQAEEQAVNDLAQLLITQPTSLNLYLQQLADEKKTQVLLFVDQLEEICFLDVEDTVIHRFLSALCLSADDAEAPIRTVFTARDDFISRLARGTLAREVFGQSFVLSVPGPRQLANILDEQAKAGGCQFESSTLIEKMVAEVQGEETSLPLLQFAGRILWENREPEKKWLTWAAYEAMGGVSGALVRHADGVLMALPLEEANIARSLFIKLAGSGGTRRLLPRSQLLAGAGPSGEEVLQHLIKARLITTRRVEHQEARIPSTSEDFYEIVHESLLKIWGRIARWINESKEEHLFLTELGQAAMLWHRRGMPNNEVWEGEALRDALSAAACCTLEIPPESRRFLQAGQQRRQRKIRRRRAMFFMVLAFCTGIALLLLTGQREAIRQRDRAEQQKEQARLARAAALRTGARSALYRGEHGMAQAMLRASLEVKDDTLSRLLWEQLSRSPLYWKIAMPQAVLNLELAPDQHTIAIVCSSPFIYLLDLKEQRIKRVLRGHRDRVQSVAFSPDGQLLASAGWDGQILIWSLKGGPPQKMPKIHRGLIWHLKFSVDQRYLFSIGEERMLFIWDRKLNQRVDHPISQVKPICGMSVGPDGKLIAIGHGKGTVQLWRLDRDKPITILSGHTSCVREIHFSPDGHLLASGDRKSQINVWRLDENTPAVNANPVKLPVGHTAPALPPAGYPAGDPAAHGSTDDQDRMGHLLHSFITPDGVFFAMRFSPDNHTLALNTADGNLQLFDVKSGQTRTITTGHTDKAPGLVFAAAGKIIATGGYDRFVRIWRLASPLTTQKRMGHTKSVHAVAFHPDGQTLASGGDDTTIRFWDTTTGQQTRRLVGHHGSILKVRFSPDGRWLATSGLDKSIHLLDSRTGSTVKTFLGHTAPVYGLAFSPDGHLLASSAENVRIWNLDNGAQVKVLGGFDKTVMAVDFSKDGRFLATGVDKRILIWQTHGWSLSRTLLGHESLVFSLSFSPHNDRLASSGWDRMLFLWQLSSGQRALMARERGRIYSVLFHPAGDRIGIARSDHIAQIRSLDGREQIDLVGHRSEVNDLQFNSDGALAATASDDCTIRLWDTTTGQPRWHGPLLLSAPPRLLSQEKWISLVPADANQTQARPTARWLENVRTNTRFASADTGILCRYSYAGQLEAWEMAGGRKRWSWPLAGLDDLFSLASGCVIRSRGEVVLFSISGQRQRLVSREATALTSTPTGILVAGERRLRAFDNQGHEQGSGRPIDIGVTALLQTADSYIVGYQDGKIEQIPRDPGPRQSMPPLEDPTFATPVRLLNGPQGTLIVGYSNGELRAWDRRSGYSLQRARLHGSVIHLGTDGRQVYAATDLGDHLVLDFSLLLAPYCQIMRAVWREAPVVWHKNQLLPQGPPPQHRCAPPSGSQTAGQR